jgi:thioredoxin 1
MASGKPIEVIQLKNFVEEHPLAVVDCWAPWCGPCRMVSPVIDELAQEMDVTFGKLNVDDNQEVAMQYKIMSIPTLLIFKNGELMDRVIGALPKKEIKRKIEEYI